MEATQAIADFRMEVCRTALCLRSAPAPLSRRDRTGIVPIAGTLLEAPRVRERRFGLCQTAAAGIEMFMLRKREKGYEHMPNEHDADFVILLPDFIHLSRIRAAGSPVAIPDASELLETVARLSTLGLVRHENNEIRVSDEGVRLMSLEGTVSDDGLTIRVRKPRTS